MNEIQVTVRGNVTSQPRQVRFDDGNTVTSFRLASNARRYDSQSREWVDAGTTFVNVNCRRWMATNVAASLAKGQPVIVTGKLRERSWEKNGRSGRSLEIEADGVGHDLAWGLSQFSRVVRSEQVRPPADEQGDHMAYELDQEAERDRLESFDADGSQEVSADDKEGPDDAEFLALDREMDGLDQLDDDGLHERQLSATA